MIKLSDIYQLNKGDYSVAVSLMYDLLSQRPAEANISHKAMPTFEQHAKFVSQMPYDAWYIIELDRDIIGSIYLTEQSEVGLHLFEQHQGKGYAKQAIDLLRAKHGGPLFANIAPRNERSQKFFQELGFKLIQQTYRLEA